MKLKKWALTAEVVGAAAVVITLIILIAGIRENTEVVRVSVYGGLLDSVNDLEATIAQDPDLSRIYDAWLNRSVASLDNAEAARLALLVVTLFRGYEKAFFAWQYEVISDTEWSRFDRLICNGFEQTREISRTDGFASASEDLTAVLNDNFMNYITESCSE